MASWELLAGAVVNSCGTVINDLMEGYRRYDSAGIRRIITNRYSSRTVINDGFIILRVGKVSMRTIAEALLPANGSHANAPTTERRSREVGGGAKHRPT